MSNLTLSPPVYKPNLQTAPEVDLDLYATTIRGYANEVFSLVGARNGKAWLDIYVWLWDYPWQGGETPEALASEYQGD